MGLSGIGVTQLLIVLFIVVLIFGTKRIRQAGGDVGQAIRGVREGFKGDEPALKDIAKEVVETKKEIQDVAAELKS